MSGAHKPLQATAAPPRSRATMKNSNIIIAGHARFRRLCLSWSFDKMRAFLVLMVFVFVIAGCASTPKQSARVDYSDGIDEQEAKVIAADYLRKHLTVSLGHTGPYDAGDVWVFRITGDVVPFEIPDISPVRVDKGTGAVTWEAKPPLKR